MSAKTRSWGLAEEAKRASEEHYRLAANPDEVPTQKKNATTLKKLTEMFLSELLTQGAKSETMSKYTRELERFVTFMAKSGKHFAHEVDLNSLLEYRVTWAKLYGASITRSMVQMRLKSFLQFCVDAGDLRAVPRMSSIKVEPTQPVTVEGYDSPEQSAPYRSRTASQQPRAWPSSSL